MSEQVLDQAVLDEIIRRIVAVAQPEKIILFGSAARGRWVVTAMSISSS